MFISEAVTPFARVGLKQQQKDTYHNLLCITPNQLHFYHNQLRLCTRKPFKSLLSFQASPQAHHISKRNDDFPVHGLLDPVVGVLGGGELARMLCQAASQMGIKVNVLDPDENCPASALAHYHMVGSYNDSAMVEEFAKRCGVLTIETEHVDVATIEKLEAQGRNCQPTASAIRIIQDKYLQKLHFHDCGIPVLQGLQIDDLESAKKAGELFGYPLMLKSRRPAYDECSIAVAESEEKISSTVISLGGYARGLYAEKFATFAKELAVILARGRDDSVVFYEVVETIHRENICHFVKAPANVSSDIKRLAIDVAEKAVCLLEGYAVFAVKLFLTKDGQILLNEVSPRPHNSGDHTVESCHTSQYENHLRSILGLPLGASHMNVRAAIMCNILGKDEGEAGFILAREQIQLALNISKASIHWYDKREIRNKRKMGHFTVVGLSMDDIAATLNLFSNDDANFPVKPREPQVGIIMGSNIDSPVMEDATKMLDMFGISYELKIVPTRPIDSFASYARDKFFDVIIAGASGDAHFPGMVASKTKRPVIGVPICLSKPDVHVTPSISKEIDALNALLYTAQVPKGVQVAAVGINNAANAALLAIRIITIWDGHHALLFGRSLESRLRLYLEDMIEKESSKAKK